MCDGVGITSVGDENVTNTTTTASNGASAQVAESLSFIGSGGIRNLSGSLQVVGCSKTGDCLAHEDFSGKSEAVLKLLPALSAPKPK